MRGYKKCRVQRKCCYRYNTETGEVESNQYGELVDYIKGIMTTGTVVETRLKQWTIQLKPKPKDATTENSPPNDMGSDKATALDFDLPWSSSSVNNCRITEKVYEEFSGFSTPNRK